jgi:hypothetical protein
MFSWKRLAKAKTVADLEEEKRLLLGDIAGQENALAGLRGSAGERLAAGEATAGEIAEEVRVAEGILLVTRDGLAAIERRIGAARAAERLSEAEKTAAEARELRRVLHADCIALHKHLLGIEPRIAKIRQAKEHLAGLNAKLRAAGLEAVPSTLDDLTKLVLPPNHVGLHRGIEDPTDAQHVKITNYIPPSDYQPFARLGEIKP